MKFCSFSVFPPVSEMAWISQNKSQTMKAKSSQAREKWKYGRPWETHGIAREAGDLGRQAGQAQGRPHCGEAAKPVTRTDKATTVT